VKFYTYEKIKIKLLYAIVNVNKCLSYWLLLISSGKGALEEKVCA
jgi:hypothetical protein